ncbi:MAG: hypothetical protein IPM31_10935 [Anaerolineae bacterium]|nr:hypothetical protein [Anaerolineae bacterium]MBL8104065.1 hypothetical protein [Anaerolineales bacterium]MCC7190830.1 hypothetical protein [Anaerolineales bacterium]
MLVLRILIVLIMIVVGYLIGFGISVSSLTADQPAWKQLPLPPAEVIRLIPAAGEPPLYIETLDGNIYHYQAEPQSKWVKDLTTVDIVAVDELQMPCALDDYEFSISPAPSPFQNKCFKSGFLWGTGFRRYTALIDDQGIVWEFDSKPMPDTILVIPPIFGLLGILGGGAIGLAIAIFVFREPKARLKVVSEEKTT